MNMIMRHKLSPTKRLMWLKRLSNGGGGGGETTKTASGSFVHVTDALAQPLVGLTANITTEEGDSGWTGCDVVRTGKNLFHGEIPITIFIKAGETVTISGKSDGNYQLTSQIERADGTRYSAVAVISAGNTSGSVTRTIPSDGVGVRIYASGGGSKNNFSDIQIEVNSTATDYEPYSGQTIPITFPDAAGTVYSGTLDVLTGVLTVNDGGTPQTYQLTPNTVTALEGENNIWASTGDVTVKYKASAS